MNTKTVFASVLFAAAAVSTGAAFASDFTAAQGNPSVQIAQLAPRAEHRSVNVATGAAKEAAPVVGVSKADARPRAEVRSETRGYFNSAEGREARALYVGGAQ